MDPYKILGVDNSADETTIKKAYRKLAMELHPDKNPGNKVSEAKFKDVNEAYEVLKDSKKKANYDRFGTTDGGGGHNPFGGCGGHYGCADVDSILKDLFGQSGFHSGFGDTPDFGHHHGFGGQQRRVNLDTNTGVRIPLGKAVNGGQVTISVNNRQVRINIPKGIKNWTKLKLKGHGQTVNGHTGDMYVKVELLPENGFVIKGNNIVVTELINLKTAIFGGTCEFDFFGDKMKLTVPRNTKPGQKLRIPKGLSGGSTFIILDVILPKAEDYPELEAVLT